MFTWNCKERASTKMTGNSQKVLEMIREGNHEVNIGFRLNVWISQRQQDVNSAFGNQCQLHSP